MIFKQLQIGQHFHYNGTEYVKQSSRTAFLANSPAIWFYFSIYQECN